MKLPPLKKLSAINIVLYAMMLFIILGMISNVKGIISQLIKPTSFEEISMGGSGIPIMRPMEDAIFYISPRALEEDPGLHQRLQRNEFFFGGIHGLALKIIFLLMFYQMSRLIASFRNRDFYGKASTSSVRNMSWIMLTWVVVEFIAYQSLQLAIPISVCEERINYITFQERWRSNLSFSIDLHLLLIAYAFYIISVVFRHAAAMKEETDLTV